MVAMLLVGAILGIGLLLGWGFGGRLRNLAILRIELWWLAPIALALQVIPLPELEGDLVRALPVGALLLSFFLLTVVAAVNWRLPGFVLILIGVVMNFAVIAVNLGMPVSADALTRLGHSDDIAQLGDAPAGAKHHLATRDDLLTPIGDVIPVEEPFDAVVSPGDVVAYSGAAVLIAAAMLRLPERRPRRTDSREAAQTTMWS